jgi:hypothetical protein
MFFDLVQLRIACTARSQNTTGCVYEEFLFRDHVLDLIAARNGSQPLFLNYAPHLVHSPLEAPPEYLVRLSLSRTRSGPRTRPW